MKFKATNLYKYIKKTYNVIDDFINYRLRKPLIEELKTTLLREVDTDDINDVTIISSNCFAGRIMQDFNMQYNSPTLGLYFMAPDYIEFLSNLKYYLYEAKLKFVEHSKYSLGNQRRKKSIHWYPIGILGDKVEIHFLHYYSEKEAAEKWYRRTSRVNLRNLFIVGMEQNLCSTQNIIDFNQLPYKNKIFFSTKQLNLKSNEFIKEFRNNSEVGDPYKKGHLFYRHLIRHFQNQENSI